MGDSSFVQKTLPTDITSNLVLLPAETISQIKSKYLTSITITSLGRVLAWGGNLSGQICDGTLVSENVPTEITSVAGTYEITCTATDSSGNTSSIQRFVTVYE